MIVGFHALVYIPRFGETLRIAQDNLECKNFYAFNPNFDKKQARETKKIKAR